MASAYSLPKHTCRLVVSAATCTKGGNSISEMLNMIPSHPLG